jgi:hypothetical protein
LTGAVLASAPHAVLRSSNVRVDSAIMVIVTRGAARWLCFANAALSGCCGWIVACGPSQSSWLWFCWQVAESLPLPPPPTVSKGSPGLPPKPPKPTLRGRLLEFRQKRQELLAARKFMRDGGGGGGGGGAGGGGGGGDGGAAEDNDGGEDDDSANASAIADLDLDVEDALWLDESGMWRDEVQKGYVAGPLCCAHSAHGR